MGLFDFLKKSPQSAAPQGSGASKKVQSLAKIVADKRAQPYDRGPAIQELAAMKSREAAEALLKRFTFTIDPSITDQEEKEAAFQGVVDVGEPVLEPVRNFCEKAEVLTWPIRVLRAILNDEEYKEELLQLASGYDTDYARNVEPKLQVVGALAEVKGDDVRVAVERFFEDVNETVRFHAVQTIFAQGFRESIPALLKLFATEESVRIKNKICEGFMTKGWTVPSEDRPTAEKALRDVYDFRMTAEGSFARG